MSLSHDNFDLVIDPLFASLSLSGLTGDDGERTLTLQGIHPVSLLEAMGRARVKETLDRMDREAQYQTGWMDS